MSIGSEAQDLEHLNVDEGGKIRVKHIYRNVLDIEEVRKLIVWMESYVFSVAAKSRPEILNIAAQRYLDYVIW